MELKGILGSFLLLRMFTLGAFAIILDDHQRVLLNQRQDNQTWNLPGGRVELGELPNETVVRETYEETGLTVEIDHLIGFYGKEGESDFVLTFLCKVIGGELVTKTSETTDCRFFALDEIRSDIHPYHVWRILDAFARSFQPVFIRQSPHLAEIIVQDFWNNSHHAT